MIKFLGALAKVQEVIISFAMSVCPREITQLQLDGF
jgi:hypothetical protein